MARKFLKYLVLLVIAGNLVLFAFVFLGNQTPPPKPLPNPNGYDDFVRAGQLVTTNADDYKTMTRDQLAWLVSQNQEALKLLRTGLGRECRVPPDYLPADETNMQANLDTLERLSKLLCAQGRLAVLEGRTNDAARTFLEGFRYAQESSRGGLFSSRLLEGTCEAAAASPLRSLINGLNKEECAGVAQELETIDAREEPFAANVQNEKERIRSEFGSGLHALVPRVMMHRDLKMIRDSAESIMDYRRRVIVESAARAYELEKGKRPQNIAELVPAYLKAIPKDPTTGTNLILTR